MSKLSIVVHVTQGTLVTGNPPRKRRMEYRIRMLPEEEAVRLKGEKFDEVARHFKPPVFTNPRYSPKTEERLFTVHTNHIAGFTIRDLQRGKYHNAKVVWIYHANECYAEPGSATLEQEVPPPRPQKDDFHRPPPTRQRRNRRRHPTRPQPMMMN